MEATLQRASRAVLCFRFGFPLVQAVRGKLRCDCGGSLASSISSLAVSALDSLLCVSDLEVLLLRRSVLFSGG